MIDFVKINYDKIGSYIPTFLNVTNNSISHDNHEIAVPAIEVWNVIATEYRERKEDNS